ncbi:restriction endonuclease subunit S [Pseudarthrobacter oxydans]|uniref:restriction endonuclease subunit S n=1 Tax=Pseudarthrobacter oxydans TaxID=1671 RepID=UPI0038114FF3
MTHVSLGQIATIDRKAVKPEDIVNGTTYVGLENIVSGGEFVSIGPVANGELASGKFEFDERHILYGKLRPYLAKIAVPSFNGVCSTDILPIRVSSSADKMYVAHFLRQTHIVNQVNGLAAGANLPRISPSSLLTIQLPLPPLDEQRRIAAILDKADELRTKRREALAHLDTLTQSIFHSMFGEALPDALLSDAIGRLVGGKNVVGPDDSPNAFRVLKISSVTSGQYLETESKPLPEDYEPPRDHVVRDGDVIISRANTTELVGASALAESTNGTSVLPDKLWRAVPTSRTNSRFLVATLQSAAVRGEISRRSSGSGGSMKNISQPKLLSIPIALPPLELQQTFATRVAAVERLKETNRNHLAELDTLFASLQHRAFNGEL